VRDRGCVQRGESFSRVVELLLQHAEIDKQDITGFTALIGAAYSGHPAVVRRLLLAGARAPLLLSAGAPGSESQG